MWQPLPKRCPEHSYASFLLQSRSGIPPEAMVHHFRDTNEPKSSDELLKIFDAMLDQ